MDKHFFFIGIDVSKDELVAVGNGTKVQTFHNSKTGVRSLIRWASKHAGDLKLWFVMESSGVYSGFAARHLIEAKQTLISIVEPSRIKAHARAIGFRSKTDSLDAQVILNFASKNKLHLWQPPTKAMQQLRLLVDQVKAFKRHIRQLKNRMHAHKYCIKQKTINRSNQAVIRTLEREIVKLDREIEELVETDETLATQVKLLKTIPGIQMVSACQILAYTGGEITNRTPKQLTAFAGLAPAQRQSGTSLNGQSRIDKRGCAPLRGTLWMCSLSGAQNNDELKGLYQRLTTRDVKPLAKRQARVAVMRKILLLARAILVSGIPYNPSYAQKSA